MIKKILIGICLLLVLLLVLLSLGATFKGVPLSVLLNEYQEECYRQEMVWINKTEWFCNTNWRTLQMCYHCYDRWTLRYKSEEECEIMDIDCHCPKYRMANRTIRVLTATDRCLKYHLVRGGLEDE